MPYQIIARPDEPIITVTMTDPFDFVDDVRPMIEQIAAAAAPCPNQYFVIYEFPNLTVTFSDVVMTLAEQSSKMPGSVSDPRVIALAVAPPDMMELAVQSLLQTQYGKLRMETFPSMDEALDYARLMIPILGATMAPPAPVTVPENHEPLAEPTVAPVIEEKVASAPSENATSTA